MTKTIRMTGAALAGAIALTFSAADALAYDGTNCKAPGNCWEPKPGYPQKVKGSKYDPKHDPKELAPLLEKLDQGYDMAVGARDTGSHANMGRLFANGLYNGIASLLTGRRIPDLTSGFRAARAKLFKEFLYLLPNGFSYPTTITMAFFRSGYPVCYLPINAARRVGKSHIRPIRDGVRFMAIIFKVATLYSPLKIFLPISALFFATGVGYYAYTYVTAGRFTNMSMLIISAAVIVFLIGLISEQITALTYKKL